MEAVGLASGVLALATVTIQSSKALYDIIEDLKNQSRTVRDLKEELEALCAVLESLKSIVQESEIDLSTLKLPLLRCGQACQDFASLVKKCTSRSESGKVSVRDWVMLTYHGKNIGGFKNLIAAYKSTISIALADANIRYLRVTSKTLHDYKEMISHTVSDLEEILQDTDPEIGESTLETTPNPQTDMEYRLTIEAERASLLQCIKICQQVTGHIAGAQVELLHGRLTPPPVGEASTSPDRGTQARLMTSVELNDCKTRINLTGSEMRTRLKEAEYRLAKLSTFDEKQQDPTGTREQNASTAQQEIESIRKCLSICAEATEQAERINVFEDITMADDAHQVIVATLGDLISAKRVSTGARSVMVMGQMSDASLQNVSKTFADSRARNGNSIIVTTPDRSGGEQQPRQDENATGRDGKGRPKQNERFEKQHGSGRRLS